MQFSEGELRGAVDGHEEVELSLLGSHLGNVDVKIADRVFPERLLRRFVAFDVRQPADAMALIAAMKRRPRQVWDGGLQGIKAISSGKSVCLRKATAIASSSSAKTVERGSFGPMGASWTKDRFFHLATVLGLMPWRSASSLAVAFDRCIAALIACVVVALP